MAAFSISKLLAPLLLLLLLMLASPALARSRHVVAFRAPGLRPSSLLWDSAAQHFLVGSRGRPAVTSVSDAGVLEAVVSDPDLPAGASLPSIALDPTRRRLLAVVAGPSPACLAAYDLRSPRPHRRLFLTPIPDPAAVAVDPATGTAFVTSASGGVIWRVDLRGESSVFSRSEALGEGDGRGGLAGIAHVGKGYLLAVQPATGKVIKVDAEDGKARAVLIAGKKGVAGAEVIAIRGDGSAAVAGGRAALIVTSDDGWGEAGVYDELALGGRAGGVAVRDGRRRRARVGVGRAAASPPRLLGGRGRTEAWPACPSPPPPRRGRGALVAGHERGKGEGGKGKKNRGYDSRGYAILK